MSFFSCRCKHDVLWFRTAKRKVGCVCLSRHSFDEQMQWKLFIKLFIILQQLSLYAHASLQPSILSLFAFDCINKQTNKLLRRFHQRIPIHHHCRTKQKRVKITLHNEMESLNKKSLKFLMNFQNEAFW